MLDQSNRVREFNCACGLLVQTISRTKIRCDYCKAKVDAERAQKRNAARRKAA